jgi:hypothetical protein
MRTIFLLLALVLAVNLVLAQTPARDFSITVTDNAGGTKVLQFGLDPTATNGLNAALGESELPPFPPSGVFEVRFIGDDISVPELGQGTYKDYRNGTGQHVGNHIHEIRYQAGTGTNITISWNFPRGMSGRLQDIITGTLIDQTMANVGNFTVTNPGAFNKLKMTMDYLLTSVEQISEVTPSDYQLNQNFPNPFNPVTTIEFSLPALSEITLKIYNAAGQKIQTLANKKLAAGTYRAHWNAQAFPSGTYFYRLQAGSFVQTKKLVLLK